MMLPTLKIELNAVWRHGRWEVVDHGGKCLMAIGQKALTAAAQQCADYDKWKLWRSAMQHSLRQFRAARTRLESDGWGRKWQSILAGRRRRCKKPSGGSGRRRRNATDWDKRLHQLAYGTGKNTRHKDQWSRWCADTVRNIKHRAACREANRKEDAGST